jgi:hypothetical protein
MNSLSEPTMNKITPFLWFDANAEAAADFYLSIFPGSRKLNELRTTEAGPGPKGSLLAIDLEIEGQQVTFLNGGPSQKLRGFGEDLGSAGRDRRCRRSLRLPRCGSRVARWLGWKSSAAAATAPLGSGTGGRGGDDGAHGGADFGFGDGDDAVDEGRMWAKLRSPTLWVRRPSAMVRLVSSAGQVTMEPVRKLSAVSPASSGSTPKRGCGG